MKFFGLERPFYVLSKAAIHNTLALFVKKQESKENEKLMGKSNFSQFAYIRTKMSPHAETKGH